MLILWLLRWFFGYGRVTVQETEGTGEEVLNYLLTEGIAYWAVCRDAEGALSLSLERKDCKKLSSYLDKNARKVYYSIKNLGFPALCRRYRRRPGIAVGAVLFCLMLWLSSRFLWAVEIVGEVGEPAALRALLAEEGCVIGRYIPTLDCYELSSALQMKLPDIAWVSVNILGNTAYVELHEEDLRGDILSLETPSNLIATADGVIDHFTVYSGKPVVKVGDNVRAGDLLVSGVVDSRAVGYRLVRSYGQVVAQMSQTFTVRVPCRATIRSMTGAEQKLRRLQIFGLTLPLFPSGGEPEGLYEEERDSRAWTLPGGKALPVIWHTLTRREYAEETIERSDEETATLAESEMAALLTEQLRDAELLQRSQEAGFIEDAEIGRCYEIRVTVVCLRDIARERPLEHRDTP